jgi:D-hexose-6-phosphate mutarotase
MSVWAVLGAGVFFVLAVTVGLIVRARPMEIRSGRAEYHDKLLDRHVVQAGPVTLDGEVDRVYSSTSDVILRDPALARSVTIAKSGSASTIVWNPWVDKSRAMADFGDEEWRDMVCVETGNVGDRAITLHPGEAHEMKVIVSVSSHRPSS